MHAKYEVSISYGSKVIAKVKVDNRHTDRTKTIPSGRMQNHGKVMYFIIQSENYKNYLWIFMSELYNKSYMFTNDL